jgi:hypothetical protein
MDHRPVFGWVILTVDLPSKLTLNAVHKERINEKTP